ncbi:diguanylate cyclase (GGDEF)-like protein [Kineococcus xinjiangensis]|uniref:Diguanylate cyclase (GGDEF)-like protein n=1 Tax=Kineococcus xinjiangensis TaxID=512762 RepID=A0A2S6ID24_9ACTN|nr:GGDEF and EAL domain-containing protein [Kineococcus xinjiangensis]PPK92124.1 diguanylate cyclase (GGDEF)-like protein [Kineococcus xinjiangensis]
MPQQRPEARAATTGTPAPAAPAFLHALLETLPVGVITAGADGAVTAVNAAARQWFGLAPDTDAQAVLDVPLRDGDARTALPAQRTPLARALAGECVEDADVVLAVPGQALRALRCSARPVTGDGGSPLGALVTMTDVSERLALEEQLREVALRDALTGLPNRTLLLDRVQHALSTARRDDSRLALLSCDLDGFKEVNGAAGHAAGDALLREVATRLQRVLRPGDTVARLGGDEFALLCPDITDENDARAIADRVVSILAEPFQLPSGAHLLGVSVGLALSTRATTAELLLGEADDAMYTAKRSGKGRSHLFDVEVRAAAIRASALLAEAAAGLEREEFVLYGQPVVDIVTGRATAVETLIRWQHPTRGLLFPGAFLETVEHSWLMIPLGRWVLDASCRMAAGWLETLGPDAPAVHVNVSGRQLETGTLAADVEAALERHGLPGRNLVVELTETHVAVIDDALRADLARLRARGVRLAVDDLGTGYSALTSITELPVDVLKVDRSFVRDIADDPSAAAVVRAVIGIGGALGLSVVAEGVETAGQQDFLRRHGCDSAQGFLWSPARPDAELVELLRSQGVSGGLAEQEVVAS